MRKRELAVISAVFLIAAGGGIAAMAGSLGGSAADAAAQSATHASAVPAGPGGPALRDAMSATAVPVFTLANGEQVRVARTASGRCLLGTRGIRRVAAVCASNEQTADGRAITVTDECGYAGESRMEITGLAPEGTSAVKLRYSDDASRETTVNEGAFRFEGTNPAEGDPYPTGVEWLNANGLGEGTAPLPVNGDEFCLPAE